MDLVGARSAYARSCLRGFALACTNLGFLHEHGLGTPKDEAEGRRLLRAGLRGGNTDPKACSNLAIFRRRGRGGPEDAARAAALFEKACAGGEASACSNLGTMQGAGEGVARDDGRAASFYEGGCEAGDALGCYNLGVLSASRRACRPTRPAPRTSFGVPATGATPPGATS